MAWTRYLRQMPSFSLEYNTCSHVFGVRQDSDLDQIQVEKMTLKAEMDHPALQQRSGRLVATLGASCLHDR